MRRGSTRYDFDLVLAGDFREAGEVAETMASHLASLAGRGLELGLLWLRNPALPRPTPVTGRLAELVRRHTAVPLPPELDEVSCRVLMVYHPHLLAGALPDWPQLTAAVTLAVLCGAPDLRGRAAELGAAADAIARHLSRRQLWCPATPQIRAQCHEHLGGLELHAHDLPPLEPIAAWRSERAVLRRQRPILGRMLRPDDDALPAKREALLAAHPAEPDLAMRFLGGTDRLVRLAQPLPPGWQLLAAASIGAKRFLSRLDAYVHYHDEPQRRFPRGALQAMAAGRLAILPPGLRAVLGDGPVYREPDQVAETVRFLQGEDRFYARYLEEQDNALEERFGPQRLLDLLAEFLKPARQRPAAPRAAPRTVALYPTNGVGLGHVTRLLAIARRLPPGHEPVFFTPCHALAVIERAGYRAEYVPEPTYDETAPADHAAAMAPRLLAALRHYEPDAIVFDGNVPRQALLEAAAEIDAPLVWVRRGMWRADPALARHMALSQRFDAVIEPVEAAAAADRGATASATDEPLPVPPVMLLDRAELEPRAAARAALGLDPDRPAALVQLGSGSNNDIERTLDQAALAARRLDLQLVVAEWLIQQTPVRRQGLRYLAAFPNARLLRAFDFALSAAGYNSFHELLHLGVPTIFLPNDHQQVDDQRARAAWAESRGAAICLPRGAEAALGGYMAAMLDPGVRRQLARRARALCPTNGAMAAATAIAAIAVRG